MTSSSVAILMYRLTGGRGAVLLVHPGGPFWQHKEFGAWFLPKGEPRPGAAAEETARREFSEELGTVPEGPLIPLGRIRQRAGKVVAAFALEGDLDTETMRCSSEVEIEWPRGSGRMRQFPEIDRAGWFMLAEARLRILETQRELLERLENATRFSAALDSPTQTMMLAKLRLLEPEAIAIGLPNAPSRLAVLMRCRSGAVHPLLRSGASRYRLQRGDPEGQQNSVLRTSDRDIVTCCEAMPVEPVAGLFGDAAGIVVVDAPGRTTRSAGPVHQPAVAIGVARPKTSDAASASISLPGCRVEVKPQRSSGARTSYPQPGCPSGYAGVRARCSVTVYIIGLLPIDPRDAL